MSSRPNIKELLFSIGRLQVRILLIPLAIEARCWNFIPEIKGSRPACCTNVHKPLMDL
jgi:hypothetical protein